MSELNAEIYLYCETAANLAAANQVFGAGRPIFEVDTHKLKVGDGSTAYNSLPYVGVSNDTQTIKHDAFLMGKMDEVSFGLYENVYRALVSDQTAFRVTGDLLGVYGYANEAPGDGDRTVSVICERNNNEIVIAELTWAQYAMAATVETYFSTFDFLPGDFVLFRAMNIKFDSAMADVCMGIHGTKISTEPVTFASTLTAQIFRAYYWYYNAIDDIWVDGGTNSYGPLAFWPPTIQLRNSYNLGSPLDETIINPAPGTAFGYAINSTTFTKALDTTQVWEVGIAASPGARFTYHSDSRVGGVGAGDVLDGLIECYRLPNGLWRLRGEYTQVRHDAMDGSVTSTVRFRGHSYAQPVANGSGNMLCQDRLNSTEEPTVAINLEYGDDTGASLKRWSGAQVYMQVQWS